MGMEIQPWEAGIEKGRGHVRVKMFQKPTSSTFASLRFCLPGWLVLLVTSYICRVGKHLTREYTVYKGQTSASSPDKVLCRLPCHRPFACIFLLLVVVDRPLGLEEGGRRWWEL